MVGQANVGPTLFSAYEFASRQATDHRAQIRAFYGLGSRRSLTEQADLLTAA